MTQDAMQNTASEKMSIFAASKITQALVNYQKQDGKGKTVLIAYGSFEQSRKWAREVAAVFAANDVYVYVFQTSVSVPVLSYAVRNLSCEMGIYIEGSPGVQAQEGYKIYEGDGSPIGRHIQESIFKMADEFINFVDILYVPYETALAGKYIYELNATVVDDYLQDLHQHRIFKKMNSRITVVCIPLSEAASYQFETLLKMRETSNVYMRYEDPGIDMRQALQNSLKFSKEVAADVMLVADPSCAQIRVAIPQKNTYRLLSSSEVGALLLHYLVQCKKAFHQMPEQPIIIKSIVGTEMADSIARANGIEIIHVLPEQQHIGEQIRYLEQIGQAKRFLFGVEDDFSYVCNSDIWENDGLSAGMYICEMADYYKSKKIRLLDVLQTLYKQHGYFKNKQVSYTCKDKYGYEKMQEIMDQFRYSASHSFAGFKVTEMTDFKKTSKIRQTDILSFELENKAKVVIRPSDSEPKLNIDISVCADSVQIADWTLKSLLEYLGRIIPFLWYA